MLFSQTKFYFSKLFSPLSAKAANSIRCFPLSLFFFFYFSRLFLPFQRKKLLLKLLILAFLDVIFRMSLLLRHSAALQRGQLCLVKDASGSQARFPGWQLVLGLAGILFCQCFSRHLLSVIFPIIAGSPLGLLPSASQ